MSEVSRFQFDVISQAIFEGEPGSTNVALCQSSVGFRLSDNLDEEYYVRAGRPTEKGVYPVLNTQLAGIASFCRACGEDGTALEGDLIRYAIQELERLFLHPDAIRLAHEPLKL